jgi:F1F0 ATPase subunit 2
MNDIFKMILVFIAGLLLGTLFFGGLWLTVKKAVTSKKPAMIVLGSFVFRIGITFVGFYFIGAGSLQRLLLLLLGFITARFLVIFFTKSIDGKQAIIKEVNIET